MNQPLGTRRRPFIRHPSSVVLPRALWSLAFGAFVLVAGSSCAWLKSSSPQYALPRVLPPSPTLEQVIHAVNSNAARIHSFSTDQARLAVPGLPSLSAAIAFERVVPESLHPMRLRFRAGTTVFGTEIDLGSNEELFWIWIRRQPPLYYCRHDQFAASPARHLLPIEPEWLVEALGLAQFDPALPHDGPYLRPGGRLEVRTIRDTASGPMVKITVIDAATGVVLEQHLYDSQRHLVASALTGRHRRDPATTLIMPRIVEIHCPQAQFSMRLDLGNVRINRPVANPAELWTMPTIDRCPMVDLGNPNQQFGPGDPARVPTAAPARRWRPALGGPRRLRR